MDLQSVVPGIATDEELRKELESLHSEINFNPVVWKIQHDLHDFSGPGWLISSLRLDSEKRFQTKSEAVENAFRLADEGDVLAIWDKEGTRDEPALEYVH